MSVATENNLLDTVNVEVRGAANTHGPLHFLQLDSLRGIAALVVVIHHWHTLWKLTPHSNSLELFFELSPIRLLINGHSSVMMFFVLSGFVLSLPQVRGKSIVYPTYLIKRTCRIYLPYLFALALALLCCWQWHGLQAYGEWFQWTWHARPDWQSVRDHLLFIGDYHSELYNTAFWTLILEMRISIVFPFLCAALLRLGGRGATCAIGLALLVGGVCEARQIMPATYAITISELAPFALGVMLARFRGELGRLLRQLNWVPYWGLIGILILGYAYIPSIENYFDVHNSVRDFPTAMAAFGLILYALEDRRIGKLLLHRILLWLGRISYSLYLLHGTVLFACAYMFYGKVNPLAWFVPYLLIALGGACMMYRYVELPSIAFGKFTVGKLRSHRWYLNSHFEWLRLLRACIQYPLDVCSSAHLSDTRTCQTATGSSVEPGNSCPD